MESLVEVSEQEVRIDFTPNTKCRANVRLRSLCPTSHVAFKVQTSSPHKFLVNPPAGLIAPLSCATFQVILKPQANPPNPFPRSPSDRFLIRTAQFPAHQQPNKSGPIQPNSVLSWFASRPSSAGPTQNHKLKTAFVGAFLLRRAVAAGDHDAARNLIRRQKSLLAELSPSESESLLRAATELAEPEGMVNLLLESGLKLGLLGTDAPPDKLNLAAAAEVAGLARARDKDARGRDARTALHRAAAAKGDRPMLGMLVEAGADPTLVEDSPIDVARDKGHTNVMEILERGEAVLMAARRGDLKRLESLLKTSAVLNFCDQYGLTAVHAAAMKGHKDVLLRLIEFGVDLESRDHAGHSPLHLAVVGGSLDAVHILVGKGADVNVKSSNSVSPLYMATAMGDHDIAEFLISKGASSSS